MRLSLRSRLLLISLALIVPSLIASHLYLRSALDRDVAARIRSDVAVRTSLVEQSASLARLSPGDRPGWDGLADELGRRAAARVTLIGVDGAVLGDSEVPLGQLSSLENHRDRPEVRAALEGRTGESLRQSTTLGRRMAYSAVAIRAPSGAIVGVARVALPVEEVDRALGTLSRLLLWGTLVALGLAIALSSLAAHWMSAQVRQVTGVAQRMAQGELTARARSTGTHELAVLGQTLDRLAEGLSSSLEALRGERDLLGRILDGMGEGVLLLDLDGRVVRVNPALRQMLALPPGAEGRTVLELVRHAKLNELLEQARRERANVGGEVELPGPKSRSLLVHAAPLSGEPAGVLAIFVELTEVRRLEAMRKDFVANASHELRTPVTAIRSAAETLGQAIATDPEAAAQFAQIIERNAERLQRLIQDLLDLSRIESKELSLELRPVALAPAFEQTLALFREQAGRRKLALELDVPPGVPEARADPRALDRVLSNLVDNAVKYVPEGGRIRLAAVAEDGRLRVSVSDSGPGIEPRHLPRLFERFYRIDAGRSREVGGTGLGLSIVKNLVEAMGGRIWVESAPSRGTTFTFTLPRWP